MFNKFAFSLILFLHLGSLAFAQCGACDKEPAAYGGTLNWNDDASWTPSGVPTADDNVCIDGSINFTITGDIFINDLDFCQQTGGGENIEITGDGGTLHITGGLNIGNQNEIVVHDLTLSVAGNITVGNAGNIDVDGTGVLLVEGGCGAVSGGVPIENAFGSSLTYCLACPGEPAPKESTPGLCNTLLPVSLTLFEAYARKQGVELKWQTASEEQNAHFVIERSGDGYTFESIGEVDGQGTTYQIINYRWEDPRPLRGKNYYRLRQVDYDKTTAYSKVRYVNWEMPESYLEVFPNPTTDALHIYVGLRTGGEGVYLQLTDLSGHILGEKHTSVTASGEIIWQGFSQLRGLYILRVQHSSFVQQVKVLFE